MNKKYKKYPNIGRSLQMENKDQEVKENNLESNDENQKLYPHQLPLSTLFAWFISILNGKSWEYLGLMMNPETKEVNQDLDKAKITIDSIEFLLSKIKNELRKDEKIQLEDLLANLQMNYVEKRREEKEKIEKKVNEK